MFFNRYFSTIISLKPIQIVYQIYYKFVPGRSNLRKYNKYLGKRLEKLFLVLKYDQHRSLIEISINGSLFKFLNQEYDFKNKINWNYLGSGKLWNYNLQYLDYILDNRIDISVRRKILQLNSIALLNGDLKPEPYPVSLRINNILIFNSFFGINDVDVERALKLQIDFLEKNLEYHILANHLLENYITLFLASYALNDYKLNDKFSHKLLKELEEQILDDGCHFERSPMYHCVILYRLLLCIDVIENNGCFENTLLLIQLKRKCGLMIGWLEAFSYQDGSWPLVNDSANFICFSKSELEKFAHSLKVQTIQTRLKSSGFRKLKIRQFEVLINLGNINPKYQCGHAHSDLMSFYLWKNNKQLIVDTGVSTYECNNVRFNERSTLAHNTITINGNSQSDVWGSFRIGKKAKLTLNNDKLTMLSADVNNMLRSSFKTKHQRNFNVINNDTLRIADFVTVENAEIVSRIHFDYRVKPKIDGCKIYFDDFVLKYDSGLISLQLETYDQAIGFNFKKKSCKIVACVENVSSFTISESI